jgi:hypothetical protein
MSWPGLKIEADWKIKSFFGDNQNNPDKIFWEWKSKFS